MAEENVESVENFYGGSYKPVDPEFNEYFIGARVTSSDVGAPTSPQTADQIRQATSLLNTGMKTVEMGTIDPNIFEQIPRQHFKELKRLREVTGSDISVHAPLVDPAGLGERGWTEDNREASEKQIISTIERSHEIDPEGNVPVTIHGGVVPIQEWAKKDGEDRQEMVAAVDRDSGQLMPVRYMKKEYPVREGERPFGPTPQEQIKLHNELNWQGQLGNISYYENWADGLRSELQRAQVESSVYEDRLNKGLKLDKEESERHERLKEERERLETRYDDMQKDVKLRLNEMFHKAWTYGSEEDHKKLEKLKDDLKNVGDHSQYMRRLHSELSKITPPDVLVPADKFAQEHTAKTVGNAAFAAYKKFGDSAPVIALENNPGTVMTRSEEGREIIQNARDEFANKLVSERGMGQNDAKRVAEKMIGMTLDLGHINMMRGRGYGAEDVAEEVKKAAPYVKKLHISDNFGFTDSHLPPGMANVPIKESLEELERQGVKVPNIVEAGGFVQHFATNPHPYILEALGSPLYSMMMAEPYWNQIRRSYGADFSGYGEILPDQHFRTYGTGFSGMPVELGGEMPGERNRFAGAPNE